MAEREKVLEIRDLSISFRTEGAKVNAIRGVDLDLYRGETIAIVGRKKRYSQKYVAVRLQWSSRIH